MHPFGVAQNAGIAFRVGFSYKDVWTPHMRIFCVAQNAGIAFRVGFSYK
jgi:hypothetical protein